MSKHVNAVRSDLTAATMWIAQDPRRASFIVGAITLVVTALAAILGVGGHATLVAGPVGGGNGTG